MWGWVLGVAGVLLALAPASSQATAGQGAPQAPERAVGAYRLMAGDQIDVKFFYRPDLNDSVLVRPDGFISLQLVGDIHAEGETPTALSARLDTLYGSVLKQPSVTVIVRQFGGRRVYVTGEVNVPGIVQMVGATTALQAIANSGGLKTMAKTSDLVLIRYAGGNQAIVERIDAAAIIKGKAPDVSLLPYDVLYVPRSKIAQLDLWVDQYVNGLIPKALLFPYNLNSVYTVR